MTRVSWGALAVAFSVLGSVSPPAGAGESAPAPGDRVKVVFARTPVKIGTKTVAALDVGTELPVLKVQGKWIWTEVLRSGRKTNGWVFAGHVSLVEPGSQPAASGTTARRQAEPAVGGGLFLSHGGITSVAFSPDGTILATASEGDGGCAKLWELPSGRELRRLETHRRSVHSVAFSPDGKRVAVGSNDRAAKLKLYEVRTGDLLRSFDGHRRAVHAVAFSPNGNLIASASEDKTVRLWDVITGEERDCLDKYTCVPRSLSFSPNGQLLAIGTDDGKAFLWAVRRAQAVRTIEVPSPAARDKWQYSKDWCGVRSVAFAPDGESLLTSMADRTVKLWDVSTGRLVRVVHELKGKKRVSGLSSPAAFSPNGRFIVHAGVRLVGRGREQTGLPTVRLTEAKTGKEVRSFVSRAAALAFSPDGRRVAIGAGRGAKLWDPVHERYAVQAGSAALSVSFSPDGKCFAVADGNIHIFEVASGAKLQDIDLPESYITSAIFSPEGRYLAAAGQGDSRTARLFDTRTWREVRAVGDGADGAGLAFAPNGEFLATAGRRLTLWNVRTGQPVRRVPGGDFVVFSPDGRRLFTCADYRLATVDMGTGAQVGEGLEAARDAASVAVSPDGRYLAWAENVYGEGPGRVCLWSIARQQQHRELKISEGGARHVSFSPDGQLVAAGCHDKKIRFWNIETGSRVLTLVGHSAPVSCGAFSPTGRTFISCTGDYKDPDVRVWDVSRYVKDPLRVTPMPKPRATGKPDSRPATATPVEEPQEPYVVLPRVGSAPKYVFVRQWGRQASAGTKGDDPEFNQPRAIAVDSAGFIYVGDSPVQPVRKFTIDGKVAANIGGLGIEDGNFIGPSGIAVGPRGHVYVTDVNHRVQVMTAGGEFVRVWGSEGWAEGRFRHPSGIAVDSKGFVYVLDAGNHRVQKFTSEGAFVRKWGREGTRRGQFKKPSGIATDTAGFVYVIDGGRIQKFKPGGTFVCVWRSKGHAIAVSPRGLVYVLGSEQVQMFGSDGKTLGEWGAAGRGDGQFNVPVSIAVDAKGYVYIGEYRNYRVQIFKPATALPSVRNL